MLKDKFDVLIVGAGISGLTLAERFANVLNKKVLVIEKRKHIGGNCYDYRNSNGILIPKYGPHFFHTDNEDVWVYLNQFTRFLPFKLKVLSNVNGILVPFPVNISTVNLLFGTDIKNETEMKDWLENNIENIPIPKNSEDLAISRMGRELYNRLIKNYVKKQWDLWPNELSPEVLSRIPVKNDFDEYYFKDKYQGMPKQGYTKMFEKMLNNPLISVRLNTDFFKIKKGEFKIIIFTGKIDEFFNESNLPPLQYRSMKFKIEPINKNFFQEAAVVVYPNTEKFTRITEPKHVTFQKTNKTAIIREFPLWGKEPYYPVFSENNKKLFEKYKELAGNLEKEGIFFIGRLAQYKYFDMDDAFKNALDFFDRIKGEV